MDIDVSEAREKVQAGEALLVCAYESNGRFRRYQLEGAISSSELEARAPKLPESQTIIVYCA